MKSLIPVHSQLLWESRIFKTHTIFSCFFSWPSNQMQDLLNLTTISFYTFIISPFLWSLSDSYYLFFANGHMLPPLFFSEPLAWRSEGIMSLLTFCGSPLPTEISQCISQALKFFIIWLQTFFPKTICTWFCGTELAAQIWVFSSVLRTLSKAGISPSAQILSSTEGSNFISFVKPWASS